MMKPHPIKIRLVKACLAILLLPLPALAQEQQFSNGQAVQLDPSKAYFLARTFERPGGALRGTIQVLPVLIRVLNEEELAGAKALAEKEPDRWKEKADPNVLAMMADEPYARAKDEVTLLAAAKPGTYVLGGVSLTNWASLNRGIMVASLCMGTVKFEAKPGVITDLGAILAARDDEPTDIPELAQVVSNKPNEFMVLAYSVAVRPATAETPVPAPLAALPRAAADYRATGPFPNFPGAPISRLAPLAGVIDYDADGNVVDLQAAP